MEREIGGYQILGPLGRGGMGAVYRALDGDGREVALKLLHPHLAADAEPRERLRREVANLQRVRHRAVARVLDAEVDSAEAFVVTELVHGVDLAERVRSSGPLSPVEVAELAARLREALDVVHAAGVLHRDLTPGNVMLTEDGPVLIDFGIAQAVEDPRVTSVGLVAGTPGYVAPELLDGGAPSESADWWGWAALLTFAATGRPPFGTGAAVAVLSRTRAGEADLDGLDPRTRAALRVALHADPGRRPTPDQVVAELRGAAAGRTRTGLPPGPPAEPATGPPSPPAGTAVLGASDGGTRVLDPDPGWVGEEPSGVRRDDVQWDGAQPEDHTQWDDDGPGPAWADDDAWPPPWPPPPEPPRRGGAVLALAVVVGALGATRPGIALLVALVAALLARSVGLDMTALNLRRQRRGPSRGDRARAFVSWPWYLLRAVPGVLAAGAIAVSVAVVLGGTAWWAFSTGRVVVDPSPGDAVGALAGNPAWVAHAVLAGAVLLASVALWFGPTARRTRVGARWVLADRRVALGLVLAAVGVVAAVTWTTAPEVVWWPMDGPPDLR